LQPRSIQYYGGFGVVVGGEIQESILRELEILYRARLY
jgi:hypothetical protein